MGGFPKPIIPPSNHRCCLRISWGDQMHRNFKTNTSTNSFLQLPTASCGMYVRDVEWLMRIDSTNGNHEQ